MPPHRGRAQLSIRALPTATGVAIDRPLDAVTGDGLEALHPLEAELIESRALDDRPTERMLGAGLEGGREIQHVARLEAGCREAGRRWSVDRA